ncbi:hypothetical protein PX977_002543 [Escherichia coli]|uniref:hypothetical protein n=1 Tax=Escherichia coli TaxID=562 RepID=UPI0012702E4C|nr:hypothetical protein [Escherichia coli]EBA8461378.1 hypothetical protein [Salmonella enterica]EDC6980833.1 hypothetical protein [Salmonella enterica subsp. enterica serovar Infantis]EBA8717310.1 hypothetical protein [Salmonella enterica]EBR3149953.1 hypothetical protein [Salmonella enterica]EDF6627123.1 hypothetical protein [Salmonella enterica subsp. enterica serovar Infantis]
MARKLKPLSRGERAVVNRKKNPISKASRDELRRLAHNLTWREIQSGALKSAYESSQRSEQQEGTHGK